MSDDTQPYSFDSYLNWRLNIDYYDDDAFLKSTLKTFAGEYWEQADEEARKISPLVSKRWQQFSDISARSDNQPTVQHFDAYGQRIDRIQRCSETKTMEKEVFGLGLFSSKTSSWEKLIQLYLIYENGEACISCPLACTEGLAALLDAYAISPELLHIRTHLKDGIDGDFAIASQFISEIHGGSDIAANTVEAIEEDGNWRLYGQKFFCSAAHADYFLVTARPSGQENIAAFVVPAWQFDDYQSRRRNHYRIDRLKQKMGTCELPTAEISFDGALAYPVEPMDKGIAHVVGIVLSCSRLTIGIFSAAVMSRAVREATNYAKFRQAFGRPIEDFPMLAGQLEQMRVRAQRTTAGFFKFYRHLQQLEGGLLNNNDQTQSISQKRHIFEVRELILLQKIVSAADSVDVLRTAMSVFGGHGVIEDFSSLPRLYRDAMVNELWEGPRNVLLSQIYRDFRQASDWYPANEFVTNILRGSNSFLVKQLSRDMLAQVSNASFDCLEDAGIEQCEEWAHCCERLFHTYQDNALAEVEQNL